MPVHADAGALETLRVTAVTSSGSPGCTRSNTTQPLADMAWIPRRPCMQICVHAGITHRAPNIGNQHRPKRGRAEIRGSRHATPREARSGITRRRSPSPGGRGPQFGQKRTGGACRAVRGLLLITRHEDSEPDENELNGHVFYRRGMGPSRWICVVVEYDRLGRGEAFNAFACRRIPGRSR